MRFLVLLARESVAAIRSALEPHAKPIVCRTASSLKRRLAREETTVVVLDPELVQHDELVELVPLLARRAQGVLLLSDIDPAGTRRILTAAAFGLGDLVLHDLERDRDLLRVRLAQLAAGSASGLLLTRLAPDVCQLPACPRMTVVAVFGGRSIPATVTALAQQSALERRNLHYRLRRAGFANASSLLEGLRLARTWHPLVELAEPVVRVSRMCEYQSVQQLRAHYSKVLGAPPSSASKTFTLTRFVDLLTRHILLSRTIRSAFPATAAARAGVRGEFR